jgi:transposase
MALESQKQKRRLANMIRHIFVGIDLGDKKSVARIGIDNQEGSERLGFVNTRAGRARLFKEVKQRSQTAGGAKILMAYEASSCGFVLRDEAQANGVECYVLAPTKMEKSVEQKKHKNDDRDAEDVLARLRGHILAGNKLPTVWVPDQQVRDDRELMRTRLELVEKQTKVKAQIQMLLKRQDVEKPSDMGSSQTRAYRRWLEALTRYEGLGCGTRQSLASRLRQLAAIEEELERLDQQIGQLAEEPRHQRIVDALRQEKGVGLVTAMVYRTEIGEAGRFRRGRHVGKFVGLTPTSHESGQQNDRKGHISRQGPPRLRKVLCQAAWVHVRHDPHSREFYQRLVLKNPKKKKIALVAVMRRLAVRLWHRMREAETDMAQPRTR